MPKRPPSSRALSTCRGRSSAAGPGPAARVLRALVLAYRATLRAAIPPSCRFAPSCSEFAVQALERHGAVRGLRLILGRLSRCHPWHAGGYDPVPGIEG